MTLDEAYAVVDWDKVDLSQIMLDMEECDWEECRGERGQFVKGHKCPATRRANNEYMKEYQRLRREKAKKDAEMRIHLVE
jgi:hypothetical protein